MSGNRWADRIDCRRKRSAFFRFLLLTVGLLFRALPPRSDCGGEVAATTGNRAPPRAVLHSTPSRSPAATPR